MFSILVIISLAISVVLGSIPLRRLAAHNRSARAQRWAARN